MYAGNIEGWVGYHTHSAQPHNNINNHKLEACSAYQEGIASLTSLLDSIFSKDKERSGVSTTFNNA